MRTLALCAATFVALAASGRAEDGMKAELASRSFRFVYQATVKDVPEGAKSLRVWVPVPVDTAEQTVSDIQAKLASGDASVAKPIAEIGSVTEVGGVPVTVKVSDIANGVGRSLCVETPGKAISLELFFDVVRRETRGGGKASDAELEEALSPDKMIPLDGKVARIADGLETKPDTLLTARELYDHVLGEMKYDKPDDGGKWGRGDSEWACEGRYGNCTDFHSYFMGLARRKHIPARFEMGFSIPGGDEKEKAVGGYHCWAYFWVDGQGWVPVDISEADKIADKNPAKVEYFFGTIDADRFTMTGGRDLVLDPMPAAGPLNFFVYPYIEVDGKPHKGFDKAFKRINK